MKEESKPSLNDQEWEKYRLASYWSHHFLSELQLNIEEAFLKNDEESK